MRALSGEDFRFFENNRGFDIRLFTDMDETLNRLRSTRLAIAVQ